MPTKKEELAAFTSRQKSKKGKTVAEALHDGVTGLAQKAAAMAEERLDEQAVEVAIPFGIGTFETDVRCAGCGKVQRVRITRA